MKVIMEGKLHYKIKGDIKLWKMKLRCKSRHLLKKL